MGKQFSYTVYGHWPFPLDMLRHDGSRAASQADQDLIDRLSTEHATDHDVFTPCEINLIALWKPNTARWESFGWSVPGDAEYAAVKRWKEEDRQRQQLIDSAMAKLTPEEREAISKGFQP